jgi:hypothetical protein
VQRVTAYEDRAPVRAIRHVDGVKGIER